MNNIVNIDIGKIIINEGYLISLLDEGVTVSEDYLHVLDELIEKFFYEKPFVYISNRLNSYAVQPNIYTNRKKCKSLIGFAIVAYNEKAKKNAFFEKSFFALDEHFQVFKTLEEAINWSKLMLKNYVS